MISEKASACRTKINPFFLASPRGRINAADTYGLPKENRPSFEQLKKMKKNGLKLYYLGVGRDDFAFNGMQTLKSTVESLDMPNYYRETTEGHIWKNWRIYLAEFSQMCFKK